MKNANPRSRTGNFAFCSLLVFLFLAGCFSGCSLDKMENAILGKNETSPDGTKNCVKQIGDELDKVIFHSTENCGKNNFNFWLQNGDKTYLRIKKRKSSAAEEIQLVSKITRSGSRLSARTARLLSKGNLLEFRVKPTEIKRKCKSGKCKYTELYIFKITKKVLASFSGDTKIRFVGKEKYDSILFQSNYLPLRKFQEK